MTVMERRLDGLVSTAAMFLGANVLPGRQGKVRRVRNDAQPRSLRCDYTDTFEVHLDEPDTHTAEQWIRTALEASPGALRRLIRIVHTRVLRFNLSEGSDADHILGWRIALSDPEACRLEAAGPLLRASILSRRSSPNSAAMTTSLVFLQYRVHLLWVLVGPVHRAVARYLLGRAAATFRLDAVRLSAPEQPHRAE
jgi:hypothetical protein